MASTKNIKELSLERDFPGPFPIRTRYAILSSPRSGSTLLARMLFATGMAGDPIEYFNRHLLKKEQERTGKQNLTFGEFLKSMEPRRTSPNGLFGMQIHFDQYTHAFSSKDVNEAIQSFIAGFNQFIWVRRRDRLRQAVSFAIARRTGAWSSEDKPSMRIRDASELHPTECIRALNFISWNDFSWEELIRSMQLDPCVIWYEDLAANYHAQCAKAIHHLGLDDAVPKIPDPPIQRQSSDLNEQVLEQLRIYLGLPPVMASAQK